MKNLKKRAAVLAAAMLTASLCSCSLKEGKTETISLADQGLEIIDLMWQMTRSQEYARIVAGSSELQNRIQQIGAGDYRVPQAIYTISINEDSLLQVLGLSDLDQVSGELQTFLKGRMPAALMAQINGMGGVENLAAANSCIAETTFVDENADENVIYLYTFQQGEPAAVSFTLGKDHTVSANGTFILFDGFTCGSAEEISSFFEGMNLETQVTEQLSMVQEKEPAAAGEEEEANRRLEAIPAQLTEAPPLALQDSLSSSYQEFEVKSGNYSWNYPAENGEMTGIVACGAGPLDQTEDARKLKIPDYQGIDAVPYGVRLSPMPDQLKVAEYDLEGTNAQEAEPLEEKNYEEAGFVELKKNRVYQITAFWEEEKLEKNGFYGEAEYVVVTE